jgi:transglutaminase/protease-like cytokinesis protein 3
MARLSEEWQKTFLLALCLALLICFALAATGALYPSADGVLVLTKKGATVDASNTAQGYVMIRHTASDKKLKVRIAKGDENATYDLPDTDLYNTFLLPYGSGKYKVQVFRQVSGNRYSNESSFDITVEIADESLPFLYPNQYVSYTAQSAAVKKAAELCEGLSSDADRLKAIRKYVTAAILYDYVRASTVQSGYLPVIDDVLAQGRGICFDYAALTACMLRTQGIPTKLEIGYADRTYHAWNSVLIGGEWRRIDTTAEANHMKIGQYTIERTY